MTRYKRLILPTVLIGCAAAASVFVSLMAERVRDKRQVRQKDAENDWVNEGGSAAATDATPR